MIHVVAHIQDSRVTIPDPRFVLDLLCPIEAFAWAAGATSNVLVKRFDDDGYEVDWRKDRLPEVGFRLARPAETVEVLSLDHQMLTLRWHKSHWGIATFEFGDDGALFSRRSRRHQRMSILRQRGSATPSSPCPSKPSGPE